ncbi:MAG TPA: BON domain-containing protein [Vicinamibacterales bacterium]|nr:BON domain-containing protein [Vicinamibacterales bacterium]
MRAFLGAVSAVVLAFTVACSQTDAGITTAVKSKLAADDTVKAYKVDVDTANKVVTLSGEVDTEAQRAHAVMIARNTDGVADVIDQLRINPTAATSGVDIDVDVDDKLEADVKRGAEATADAAKRGAQKTKEGAKKAGEEIKDVFTDDDRDSDKDGK